MLKCFQINNTAHILTTFHPSLVVNCVITIYCLSISNLSTVIIKEIFSEAESQGWSPVGVCTLRRSLPATREARGTSMRTLPCCRLRAALRRRPPGKQGRGRIRPSDRLVRLFCVSTIRALGHIVLSMSLYLPSQ